MRPPGHQLITESELIDLLAEIFDAEGLDVESDHTVGPRIRVDLLGRGDGRGRPDILFEVKNIPPQTRTRLADAVEQLRHYGKEYAERTGRRPVLALATPGTLSAAALDYLKQQGVEGYDRQRLVERAAQVGLRDRAMDLLGPVDVYPDEDKDENTRRGVLRHVEQELAARLRNILPGRAHWNPYQRVCLEILDHLFSPPLNQGKWERPNASRINRRDIIMPNYSTEGFWYHLRQAYQADHIVVEAKNYAGNVGKDQVVQMANYLSRHGTGLFGIIVTRTGGDKSALAIRREQWILYNKLILVLNDDDLVQMLTDLSQGDSPELLIQQKIEDFRLDI
ncbi:hypothetical protein SK854_05395 [Lentzea sp. BCCO 10_0061]|uniref:Restriction endonuclease type IV Mrr domain-containing protein n=1 Tax=Lentzea sokolovensis TaxID=3095429 RepID=A0ABU4UPW4_9PSEU|nr:hypothetical protein [Lentzea sp. BCCO 10_0061]MDX8141537.1 hypothetical protein [Lentzea sp. BCCO 10_0061]